MSSIALSSRETIVDRVLPRSLVTDSILVASATALIALAAQIVIPMWPVPITGQTFAVLLSATALGATRGVLATGLYWVVGLLGVPVFAEWSSGAAAAFGATSGYFLGFVIAAFVCGKLAERQWDRKIVGVLISFAVGSLIILTLGTIGLMVVLGLGPVAAFQAGFLPFLIGDTIKAVLAAALVPVAWKGVNALKK